jgi:catechol 2,3-dioxygenase-like lactoylglutathione lyase family enzyme
VPNVRRITAGSARVIEGMPRLVGLNHVALEVGDLSQALAFWRAVFPDLQLRGEAPGMAFVDIGDQFLALSTGRDAHPDAARHFGLVVDDRAATLAAARAAGATLTHGNTFVDPWGNNVQVVEYADVQFAKTPEVLRSLGLDDLRKSERARAELRAKGIELPPDA